MNTVLKSCAAACFALTLVSAAAVDLSKAVVVARPNAPLAEQTAVRVFVEEIQKRTGIRLAIESSPARAIPSIVIATRPPAKPRTDGYRLALSTTGQSHLILAHGDDPRGTLYAVGQLLRRVDWSKGRLSLDGPLEISTAPAYPIRGHQLGYRTQANSYDAWSPAQFEQYIRELTFFGANSIEGIPLHDDRPTPVMKYSRRDMNKSIGDICLRYGLDYWAWLPADFDLKDTAKRARFLEQSNEFFRDAPTLTGVFFPGGDPGNNPPELVLPFLEDLGKLLLAAHPQARIWFSLQWFNAAQRDTMYQYITDRQPRWFAGLVAGPSSPPLGITRQRLPPQYKLRDYPDLTHNKICQFQVPAWDQAYALTLGREAINPRPAEFAAIHRKLAGYTDGFISYSDGIHDDVNKTVWSALSWDPNAGVREILTDYARAYFEPALAADAADGVLALERNWHGPLIHNGAVEGTLLAWRQLEQRAPELSSNWRWQMCLLRANYDAYDRRRLIRESQLEEVANRLMLDNDPAHAMSRATEVLESAVKQPTSPALRDRIIELCDQLFHSIGLQSSVDKYFASGAERGAVLDFIDVPLNNRWWLEDQFQRIAALPSADEKRKALRSLATWEHPGPGSFYDDIGNIAKSPHVVSFETETADENSRNPEPMFSWWDQGRSRARLSWQTSMWPVAMVYEGLDPRASYLVRSTGYGQALLRMNGQRVNPVADGREMGDIKEWIVAPEFVKDGRLVLKWDRPTDEAHLNWRQHSRLSEVWLIRKD